MLSLQQRVLRKASEILGGDEALARELRITRHDLSLFLYDSEVPTRKVFLEACDIVIQHGERDFLEAVVLENKDVIFIRQPDA